MQNGGNPDGAGARFNPLNCRESNMPIILWLLGVPLSLIILLMLLGHL
jgi:hypothetical protein